MQRPACQWQHWHPLIKEIVNARLCTGGYAAHAQALPATASGLLRPRHPRRGGDLPRPHHTHPWCASLTICPTQDKQVMDFSLNCAALCPLVWCSVMGLCCAISLQLAAQACCAVGTRPSLASACRRWPRADTSRPTAWSACGTTGGCWTPSGLEPAAAAPAHLGLQDRTHAG